jgi:hypothetical protein
MSGESRNWSAMSAERAGLWTTIAAVVVTAPLLLALCLTLWRMPFPVTEAVAIFEDVANYPLSRFLIPDTAYYRPLFYATIAAIWHSADRLEAKLSLVRLLHIVPVVVLLAALIAYVRPRSRIEAAAAVVAVAVLFGSPGLRDNLELPLSYTIVGMPLTLLVWMLLNREPRWWHHPAIVVMTLVAVGFKEQGLVLVPVIISAWWLGAPGARTWNVALLAALAGAYVVVRLAWRGSNMPIFEQAVGLWFNEMEPREAAARFGEFPYLIYAYNGVSTMANVLFAEPTRGTFSIVYAVVHSQLEPWQGVHLGSSTALTALIGWWAVRAWRSVAKDGGTREARLAAALLVALLGCGALSFNYSRDRLGGMAVPFYAVAAFYAVRAAAAHAGTAAPRRRLVITALLAATAAGWGVRAIGTVEWTRFVSARNQMEWLVLLPSRRLEFAERPTYLRIMDSMITQGIDRDAPRPTRYPSVVRRFIAGLPPEIAAPAPVYSLSDAIAAGDVRQAHAFIRAGQDPNDLIVVRHPELTGGVDVFVSPVVWAIVTRQRDVLQMLLGFGARLERPAERRALCLANAVGANDIARILKEHDRSLAAEPCEGFPPNQPLLRM